MNNILMKQLRKPRPGISSYVPFFAVANVLLLGAMFATKSLLTATAEKAEENNWVVDELAIEQFANNSASFVRIIEERHPLYDAGGQRVIKNRWYKRSNKNAALFSLEEEPILCQHNNSPGILVPSQIVVTSVGYPIEPAYAQVYVK